MIPKPRLVDAQSAYRTAMASGLGHDMALESVYTAGQHAGRRQADNALNWQTTCLGCADGLDRSYNSQMSGELAGYHGALRLLDAVEHQAPATAGDSRHLMAVLRYRLKRVIAEYEEAKGTAPTGQSGDQPPPGRP